MWSAYQINVEKKSKEKKKSFRNTSTGILDTRPGPITTRKARDIFEAMLHVPEYFTVLFSHVW